MKKSLQTLFKQSHLGKALSTLMLSVFLTACGDERPVANMPDEPLAQPLEIVIEPKKVAMTNTWVAGVKDDGTLWTWGTDGLLRKTENGTDPTPTQVEGVNDAVAVSGGSHMLLLRKDGSVWGWGYNSSGQIIPHEAGKEKVKFVGELRKIEGLKDIVSISADSDNSFFIDKKSEVYVIGNNRDGWVNGIPSLSISPTKVPNLKDIIRIEERAGTMLALNNKGEVYTTGNGGLGRIVEQIPKDSPQYYPAQKVELPRKAVDITMSMLGSMALLDNGEVWVWGYVSGSGLALPKGVHPDLPMKHPKLKRIINIGDRSAVDVDGNLYMWGEIGYGYDNAPSTTIYRSPIKIAENIKDPVMLINGNNVSAVLDKQGHLHTWGWNRHGQLGTGEIPKKEVSKKEVMTVHQSLFTTH